MRSPPPAALAAVLAVVAVAAAAGALSGADLGTGPSLDSDREHGTPRSGGGGGPAGSSGDGGTSPPGVEVTARSVFGFLTAPLSPATIALGVVTIGAIAALALRRGGDPDGGSTGTSEAAQSSEHVTQGRDTDSGPNYDGPNDTDAIRAFERLVDAVDPPDRDTCSPREIQRAALDRELDPAATRTIVAAFERARYGCETADADVESALATLELDGGALR
jgi:hypothetical protein